jgi:DNA-binding Lrp family transcriptional regulator
MKDGALDRVDVSLIHILLRDSRATLTQMEMATGLNQRTIEKRIKDMGQVGLLRRFTAKPSLVTLGASSVMVWGKSRLRSLHDALLAVQANDRVAWVAHSTSGRFYFALHLRGNDDIRAAVNRLESEAMLLRPSYGVRNLFGQENGSAELQRSDWRILWALAKDHTLTGEEIAVKIRRNASEVNGRLEELISAGAIDFSIDLDPNVVSNPLCLFHLESLEPNRMVVAAEEMMKEHAPSILYFNTFSNLPTLTTAMAIGQDYEDILNITRSIQERPEFAYLEVNPLLASTNVETWRDKLLRKKGSLGT